MLLTGLHYLCRLFEKAFVRKTHSDFIRQIKIVLRIKLVDANMRICSVPYPEISFIAVISCNVVSVILENFRKTVEIRVEINFITRVFHRRIHRVKTDKLCVGRVSRTQKFKIVIRINSSFFFNQSIQIRSYFLTFIFSSDWKIV